MLVCFKNTFSFLRNALKGRFTLKTPYPVISKVDMSEY
jgi:hypothetical protein